MAYYQNTCDEFLGKVIGRTAKAVLFHCVYWEDPEWLPKSQITIKDNLHDDEVKVLVSPWLCKAKDLREFEYRPKAASAAPENADG